MLKNYCCVRCVTLIDKLEGMSWHKTGATKYHTHLGLPDKGHSIKELVVCWVLLNLIARVLVQKKGNIWFPICYSWLLGLMLGCNGNQP